MRALTAAEVLSLWERTRGQNPLYQALEYLACASPDRSKEEWAVLPFGQVCHALFHLRSIMFGNSMPGVINCPRCGERLEFTFECLDMAGSAGDGRDLMQIELGERKLEIRLPAAKDLLSARSSAELLSLCANKFVEPDDAWIEVASARVAEADPLSETMLDLVCPSCGHGWQALLDVVTYLSHEISHHARRLLNEIHRLALAYGWGEREILALSASRRRAYLELGGA